MKNQQRITELKTMDYSEYRRTPEWAEKREQVLRRDNHQCRMCSSRERLEVHHRTYARRGDEDLNDLTTLCQQCHTRFHERVKQDVLMQQTYTSSISEDEPLYKWEYCLIGLLLQNIHTFPHVVGMISEDDFVGEETRALYILMYLIFLSSQPIEQNIPFDLLPTKSKAIEIAGELDSSQDAAKQIKKTIRAATHVKLQSLLRSNEQLDAQIAVVSKSGGDMQDVLQLLRKKQQNSALLGTIHSIIRSGV